MSSEEYQMEVLSNNTGKSAPDISHSLKELGGSMAGGIAQAASDGFCLGHETGYKEGKLAGLLEGLELVGIILLLWKCIHFIVTKIKKAIAEKQAKKATDNSSSAPKPSVCQA